jgi:type IV pilus assembly protein PilQ
LGLLLVLLAGIVPAGLIGAGGAAVVPAVRLKAITSRVHPTGATLVIEATEPVPYVTARPDPMTVVLEFRNVAADGVAKPAGGSMRPIGDVSVETAESMGAAVARVRVSLVEPTAHHIRSERNTVVVDFERVAIVQAIAKAAPVVDPIAALGLDGSKPTAPPPAVASAITPSEPVLALPAGLRPAQLQPVSFQAPGTTVQQPSAPASPEQTGIGRSGRQYTGHPVSLTFEGADLRAVLRTFAEISGLNIVIDPAVQGTVDVMLTDVPWDQALDIILRANKLGYIVDGTIVRIAPLTVLADEEAQRRKLAEEQANAGELRLLTKTLSYANAAEMQGLITRSALSSRGTVQVDARTNTLIITDLEDRLNTANELIATLDRAQPQVEIEARIVQTTKNYARQLGVQWGFNGRMDPALGNTTDLAFPNSAGVGGRLGGQGPQGTSSAVNLPVGAATSAVGLFLGSVNGSFNLDVALTALEQSGQGRVLSSPRVSTLNNVEAEVTQGTQIPLQSVSNNTVTVTFKDAALTLRVTPQITAANTVIMKVVLENATPVFERAAGPLQIPPIDTQRALTTLLVNDGDTTVIGGIYQSRASTTTDRTPGLSQIPLLSWLFRRDAINDTSQELLIFITPRIIRG